LEGGVSNGLVNQGFQQKLASRLQQVGSYYDYHLLHGGEKHLN
jgi:hypothetical protein